MSKIYDALKRAERERETARGRGNGHPPDHPGDQNGQSGQEDDDYRRLRASLLFAPAYSEVRTIAITGTRHGEGATTTAGVFASILVRRRGGRKRALGTRAPMTLPQGPNQRWESRLCLRCAGRWSPLSGARCCR